MKIIQWLLSIVLLAGVISAAEYHALVDANSVVGSVQVIDAAEVARRVAANPQLTYVKCCDPYDKNDKTGTNYPGINYKWHTEITDAKGSPGAFVAPQLFKSWPLDPVKAAYVAPIEKPAYDPAKPTEFQYWHEPDEKLNETIGYWTTDKTKASAPNVGAAQAEIQPLVNRSAANAPPIPWGKWALGAGGFVLVAAGVRKLFRRNSIKKILILAALLSSIQISIEPQHCFAATTGVSGGSTPVTTGGYTYTAFTTSGTATIAGTGTIEVLVVAGAGGAASGGAGAGGLVYHPSKAVNDSDALTVTIGAGGSGSAVSSPFNNGSNGSNSVCDTITALGGGGGGNDNGGPSVANGSNGGSGGGTGDTDVNATGGSATQGSSGGGTGFGQAGGSNSTRKVTPYPGSGGGGATVAGATPPADNIGGAGGAGGTYWDGSGSSTTFAGGGGGAAYFAVTPGAGGSGGGGAGVSGGNGNNGTANTGGGGGGATNGNTGGTGGSGIVVIRFASGATLNTTNFFQIFGFNVLEIWDRRAAKRAA